MFVRCLIVIDSCITPMHRLGARKYVELAALNMLITFEEYDLLINRILKL